MALDCIVPRLCYRGTCEDPDEGIRGVVDGADCADTVDGRVEI